jgi:hypothetical protein
MPIPMLQFLAPFPPIFSERVVRRREAVDSWTRGISHSADSDTGSRLREAVVSTPYPISYSVINVARDLYKKWGRRVPCTQTVYVSTHSYWLLKLHMPSTCRQLLTKNRRDVDFCATAPLHCWASIYNLVSERIFPNPSIILRPYWRYASQQYPYFNLIHNWCSTTMQ